MVSKRCWSVQYQRMLGRTTSGRHCSQGGPLGPRRSSGKTLRWSRWTPWRGWHYWRYSKIATVEPRRGWCRSCRCRPGMRSSASPPSPMRSVTASCTPPTASTWRESRCANCMPSVPTGIQSSDGVSALPGATTAAGALLPARGAPGFPPRVRGSGGNMGTVAGAFRISDPSTAVRHPAWPAAGRSAPESVSQPPSEALPNPPVQPPGTSWMGAGDPFGWAPGDRSAHP